MSHKLYNVGMYVRLSREDTESVSIENQVSMLSKFVDVMPGWIETRTYIDDGASGTNFNRQGFKDMMEDVRQSVINLVLVKDLSRFGRNYLEVGRYLEEELPALGCRFVALTDNIDTENGENDILPFLNAINDFYVRDVSERIKSVTKARAKDGQKLSGATPYGYDRNPNDRSRLVVDKAAAKIIKRIYDMRADGKSYNSIAAALNNESVLSPRTYYFQKQGRENKAQSGTTNGCATIWSIRTIKLILCNEIYIGNTISLKRGTRSYRDSRTYQRGESEWIRMDNTHTPIVEIDVWDKVQQINGVAKEKVANAKDPQQSLFSSLLICPDCGAKMGYTPSTTKYKSGRVAKYGGYGCRTFSRSGRVACSSHKISERNLKALVLEHIRERATGIISESGMLETIKRELVKGYKSSKSDTLKTRQALEQELYALETQIDQLYEDKVEGNISAETFMLLVEKVEARRSETEIALEHLTSTNKEATSKIADIDRWATLIKEKATCIEVDRELLEALIEKIEIGERQVLDGQTTQDVRIFYKYVGLC